MMTLENRSVKGFTLVELAVVLVILGAIFMSVLKVETMIKNARIRQVVNQYRELRTAIMIYKDKYGYFPGDDPKASVHVGAISNGDGDGRIKYASNEMSRCQLDLYNAGLVQKPGYHDNDPSDYFHHAFGQRPIEVVYVYYCYADSLHGQSNEGLGKEGHAIRFAGMPLDAAQAIDTMLDDGNLATGTIRKYPSTLDLYMFFE